MACIHYREIIVSILVAIGLTSIVSFAVIFVTTLSGMIMMGVCSSDKSRVIYNRLFFDMPVSEIICMLSNPNSPEDYTEDTIEDNSENQSNMILTFIGGFLVIAMACFVIYMMYKCCVRYMCIIYHFIIPYSKRSSLWLCFNDDSYVTKLVWKDNKYTSIIIIGTCCIVGLLGHLLTSDETVRNISNSVYLYFPIVFFSLTSIVRTIKKHTNRPTYEPTDVELN